MRKFKNLMLLALVAFFPVLPVNSQQPVSKKVSLEEMLERFLSYVKIDSQPTKPSTSNPFPMTDGQRKIAQHIYNEVKDFGGKDVKVTLFHITKLFRRPPQAFCQV